MSAMASALSDGGEKNALFDHAGEQRSGRLYEQALAFRRNEREITSMLEKESPEELVRFSSAIADKTVK